MATDNKSFVSKLFTRRDKITQGPDLQSLVSLARDNGYDIHLDRSGKIIPAPQGMEPERDIDTLQARWSGLNENSSDLINNRDARMNAYDRMDRSGGEGAVTLDTLADEVINITDHSQQSLTIKISDAKMREKVMEVLERNNVLKNLRADIRALCKYGDFAYVLTNRNFEKLINIDTETAKDGDTVEVPYRVEDIEINYLAPIRYELQHSTSKVYKLLIDARKDNRDLELKDTEYFPWEYSAFVIHSRDTFPYGLSELEKMRLPWEKLAILEELLAITRANRLDKIAITVPGLKGDPTSVMNRLSQLKNSLRNIILGFNNTGSRISRNQDTGMTDYLWIPEGFEAKKLSTSIEITSPDDVEYFRSKCQNASRLPKGFFISEESSQQRPMSLRQQDIKFARSLIPIGEAYCRGLTKLIQLIIFYLGGNINVIKVHTEFKKSPYITNELMETYKGVYDIIATYKEIKGSFSESKEITDRDVKTILDLIGAPHELLFPEKEEKTTITDSVNIEAQLYTGHKNLYELAISDTSLTATY